MELVEARRIFWWINESLENNLIRSELAGIGNLTDTFVKKPIAEIAAQAEQLWAEREGLA